MMIAAEHEGAFAPFPAGTAKPARLGAHGFAWPSLLTFLSMSAIIAAVSFFAVAGGLTYWIAVPANAVCLYVLAHLNHEAFHSNISGTDYKAKWLNEAIGRFISFVFWFSMPAFRAIHFAHHRFTNDPDLDADMWMARKNPLAVIAACFTLQMRYEVQMVRLFRRGVIPARVVIEFYIERALNIALVVLAFRAGFGFEVVMLWLLPAYLTLPFLALFFAYLVHHPHDRSGDKYRNTSVWLSGRRFLQPVVTAVFVFQNYHLVHHLYPRIPFYQYGKAFRAMRADLERENAAIRTL